MQSAAIPSKFSIAFAQNAGPSYIRAIPISSQIGIVDGAASLNDGFVPLNMTPEGAGGIPPFGQDMNGILKLITQWSQWSGAGGPVKFDAAFSANIGGYPKGCVISAQQLGSFWISTVEDNVSNPETGGANWIAFTPISLYAVDSGTADAVVASLNPPPATLAYLTGMAVRIKKISSPNANPVTLTLNAFPATPIVHADGTALGAGELPANGIFTTVYDGTSFQIQSPSAASVTPIQLQAQTGNYAADTGTANAMTIALPIVPSSLAAVLGTSFRLKKAGAANTAATTLNIGVGGAQNFLHADGSNMAAGELPANGLIEFAWDGSRFVLLSPPIALPVAATTAELEAASNTVHFLTPANALYSPFAVKGWVFFRWNGSAVVINQKSSIVNSVSRSAVGRYSIQLQGGLAYTFGYAFTCGKGPSPANAGSIGMGISFTGTDPAFTVSFGDAGGSGGQNSDPSDGGVLIVGITSN